jgi:hypothetical protein
MAKRENSFLLKRSNVPGKVPLSGDLKLGELALNTADVKLYTSGTTENDIIQIGWDRISRTGDTVTGDFMFNGDLSATTISATTYLNLPMIGGGGDYLPLSGGTVTGDTFFTSGLTVNNIIFNTGYTPTFQMGELAWNGGDTLNIGLLNNHIHKVGQEVLFYGKAQGSVAKGDAIMFAGVQGDHVLFTKAVPAVINANPEYFMGIATQSLGNNDWGYVTHFGYIENLNTITYSGGTILYFDSTSGTGLLTDIKPTAPNANIIVAAVIRSHVNQGILLVRPYIQHTLDDVQDVLISGATNGDLLTYNNGVWINKPVASESTGTVISFNSAIIYNSVNTPATGNITDNLTGAMVGIVQKIYHNDSVSPTFPIDWVKLGSTTYTPSVLNIIFAEWVSGTRVEYWITKPA